MRHTRSALLLPLLLALGLAAARPAQAAPNVLALVTEPAVIPGDGSASAYVLVRTTEPATSAVIHLAAGGGTVPLLPFGPGPTWTLFSVVLPPDVLLKDYQPDDVNRNYVGDIQVTGPTGTGAPFRFFVNVEDAAIPDVPVTNLDLDVRCAPHVVNILMPAADPLAPLTPAEWALLDQAVTTRLYDFLGDDFDFINLVFALPRWPQNRSHYGVRNDVTGIGLATFDDTALYGSAGRLQGISRFPLDTFFDLAETSTLHELGHQWINFLPLPVLAAGSPHWPPSTMARGIMGRSLPGGAGGAFPFALAPLGGGMYRVVNAPVTRDFSRLDLYLMGLLPPTSVGTFVVLTPSSPSAVFAGAVVPGVELGVADVIAASGPRVPDSSSAPSTFNVATVVVTRSDLLTDRELAFFDYFAARGEETSRLPFSIGLEKGETKPFALATSGLGSLVTSVNCPAQP